MALRNVFFWVLFICRENNQGPMNVRIIFSPHISRAFILYEKQEEKYLGDILSSLGLAVSVQATVKHKTGKVKGSIFELRSVTKDIRIRAAGAFKAVHPQAQRQGPGRPGADRVQVEDLGGEGAAGVGPETTGRGLPIQGGVARVDEDWVAGPWTVCKGDLQGDWPSGHHQRDDGHKKRRQ